MTSKFKPTEQTKEDLVILPASALENVSALHINGQFIGAQDSSHDLSAAAMGRSEFMSCFKRTSWKDRVIISVMSSPQPKIGM